MRFSFFYFKFLCIWWVLLQDYFFASFKEAIQNITCFFFSVRKIRMFSEKRCNNGLV